MPWDMYEELLRYHLELRGITDEKAKKLVVMTEIGPKAYMELKKALAGKALKDVETADELLMLLQKRYSPKKLLIAERHRMLLLGQESGQSLAEFYSRIQEAANSCDFHSVEVRNMKVLQVFVKGMRSEGTRVALLQKEKLKPEEALELAQVMDMAERESHTMATGGHHEIHQVKAKSRGDVKCHEC
ncbi:zinc knuckle protein, partial [Aphelenchoides avenae]